MGRITRWAAVAAVLALGAAGAGRAAAEDPMPTAEWLKVMDMKARAVDLQNKGAQLLDEVNTDEAKQRVRSCIDDARVIFNLCEEKLRGE